MPVEMGQRLRHLELRCEKPKKGHLRLINRRGPSYQQKLTSKKIKQLGDLHKQKFVL